MVKPLRGEVEVELAGEKLSARVSIGALEEMENETGLGPVELLRSFGTNAKLANIYPVLRHSLTVGRQKMTKPEVKNLVERAGLAASAAACVDILVAVLVDSSEGNASAAAAKGTTTAE